MCKHVQSCWGDEVLSVATDAKDVHKDHTKIVGSILQSGSITTAFQQKGQGKITYSNQQHTHVETQYINPPWTG
ncbi:hypothetical protein J3R83DRAFT_2895 [Lanmaoa asiatica]|nr:hypothetical protein J3R83DRAFT_2895 [Lanmaoa asiatica]